MPYIKVKVSQDLYEDLGLCPNMELVYSDSKGSIKFVPSSSTKVLGEYESPLLTSPRFGNQLDTKEEANTTVSKVFHKELDQNMDITLSANISGNKKLISSCEVLVDASLVGSGPFDSYGTPNETWKDDDASQCSILSEEGYKSQDIVFVKRADLNESVNSDEDVGLCEDNKSDPVSTVNSSPVTKNSESNLLFQKHTPNNLTTSRLNLKVSDVTCIGLDSKGRVSSLSFTSPDLGNTMELGVKSLTPNSLRNTISNAQGLNLSVGVSPTPSASDVAECKACLNKSSFSRHSKHCNNKVKYPRKCEYCSSIYSHGSSFTRHKKACNELRDRKLTKASVNSDCDPKTLELTEKDVITYPRICDKCGLIFEKKESFRGHLGRCEKYQRIQTISTDSERKILPSCADNSDTDFASNNQTKYIPVQGFSQSTRRFFVKMKTPADID